VDTELKLKIVRLFEEISLEILLFIHHADANN